MNPAWGRLRRWALRARPARGGVSRALAAGLLASASGVALFVGAVALLVVAAQRPGLRAVAGVLIVLELFAFLRSPIRFVERLSGHRLGLAAVTQWRRWVVVAVGGWSYSRWRRYASGDLLTRALTDTDELQDLWVRGLLPLVTVIATLALGDVVVGVLPPTGAFALDAVAFAAAQAVGVAVLLGGLPGLVAADAEVRRARAAYQSMLVELSAAAPELLLLGAEDLVTSRSREPIGALRSAERRWRRRHSWSLLVPLAVTLASLGVLGWRHPATSAVWTVVVALLALGAYELLGVARHAVDTFVAVSAAAERLEDLDAGEREARAPWPEDSTLRALGLSLSEDGRVLATDVDLTVAPGQRVAVTGASGAGKSTLLRALAALDDARDGSVGVGGCEIGEIGEVELRRHLAYVASEPGLLNGLVLDVVSMGRAPTRDVLADLARVGLRVEATTRWEDLSRGERQRVAVVRSLACSPAVVVLDEPTSGLGRDETAAVLDLLGAAGPSVLVATHDEQVVAWCDVVVELRDGRLTPVRR